MTYEAGLQTRDRSAQLAEAAGRAQHFLGGAEVDDAQTHTDRVAAENLIRTTLTSLSHGGAVQDLNGVVSRALGKVNLSDVRSGQLGSAALGEVITAVESAKGNNAFNWNSASPDQIKAYLIAHGVDPMLAALRTGTARYADNGSDTRGSDGGRVQSASAYSAVPIGAVTSHNFAGTPYAKEGMAFKTFADLRAQGFGETNIVHAAQDAKQNGFDPNDKAVAKDFAVLDRDDGKRREERNRLLAGFREDLHGDEKMQEFKAAYQKATTDEERARIEQQARERGEQLSRKRGLRQHIDTMPTPSAKKCGDDIQYREIHRELTGAVKNLTPGDPAAAKRDTGSIDAYARHPHDAAARRNYSPIIRTAAADPRTRLAALQVEKAVKEKIALDAKVDGKNEVKQANDEIKLAKNELKVDGVAFAHSGRVVAQSETANVRATKEDVIAELYGDPPTIKAAKVDAKPAEAKVAAAEPKKPEAAKADAKPAAAKVAAAEPKKPEATKPAPKVRVAGMAPAPAA